MSEPRKRRQNAGPRSRTGSGENPHRGNSRSKMNSGGKGPFKLGFQRQNSYDRVRKIVQEEGRTARNLIQFNVPVEEEEQMTPRKSKQNRSQNQKTHHSSSFHKLTSSQEYSSDGTKGESKVPSRRSSGSSIGSGRRGDLRARYWAFLFENLRRAVDEIYQTCETDESVVECKEVIMMLEQCTKDFKSLIERLNLLKAYESAEEGNKPTSLAWEVRKSSPGKGLSTGSCKEAITPSPTVSRSLNFTAASPTSPIPGVSFADKVKGAPPAPILSITTNEEPALAAMMTSSPRHASNTEEHSSALEEEDDMDGWETVQRGWRTKNRNSAHSANMQHHTRVSQDMHQRNGHQSYSSAQSHEHRDRLADHSNEHKDYSVLQTNDTARVEASVDIGTERSAGHDSLKENVEPLVSEGTPSVASWMGKQQNWESFHKEGLGTLSEEFSSDDEKDDEYEEEDEDELAIRLDDALESALDAEASLSHQLEQEQNAALESAIEEEQQYLQQIQNEQNTAIEVDTEPDTENEMATTQGSSFLNQSVDYEIVMAQYEQKQMSWGDIEEAEKKRESRTPGRVVHIHEKLSSPSRKRSPTESKKRHEEKQAKAQELREKLMMEKAEHLKMLTSKVEEVRAWKEELLHQRRLTIECKMQRAEEKRLLQLKQKVRKAHEEENKANEIAFINSLEAQNKRHDIITKHQESEARLQDLQDERQRRHEEKAAKEAAVEERRKALEAERQARLAEMQERRKQRESEFEHRQQEREKERQEVARAKEKEREERMASLNAQQQAHIEELQKKIKQKQDEGARRYKENLEQIREKAFEMSILKHSTDNHNEAPQLEPYDRKKYCMVCSVMIPSEVYLLSHLRGKKHQQALEENTGGKELSIKDIEDFNLKHIADAPSDQPDPRDTCDKERQKALKKRCKKLRQRMSQRGVEFENTLTGKQQPMEAEHRAKLQKVVKDLQKYVSSQDRGPWPQNKVSALDRALGEVARIMDKKFMSDQNYFRMCGGLSALSSLLSVIMQSTADLSPVIPTKSLVHACTVFRLACKGCYDSCHYLLFTNRLGAIVDLLSHQLMLLISDNFDVRPSQKLPHNPLASALMQLTASLLSVLAKQRPTPASAASAARTAATPDAFGSRANDIVSYTVCMGIVDRLSSYFSAVRGSVDEEPQVADFLQHAVGLLTAITRLASKRTGTSFPCKKPEDPSQLILTFQTTELVGIVSLLYGTLLHSGNGRGSDAEPAPLPHHTVTMTTLAVRLLNHVALLDLHMLQRVLAEEGTWLELRHMASFLLQYCSHQSCPELMHEVILCIGYFTVLNTDNQNIMQSGQSPSVLQQLCSLPFQYFSNPRLTSVLFPTLITCCYGNNANRDILQQELSCDLLANFIEEKQLEAQQATLTPSPNLSASKKGKLADRESERISLAIRFPVEEWTKAKDYFKAAHST